MKGQIAIVEDEPDIAELVSHHLKKAGYKTRIFYDAQSFLNCLMDTTFSLVILDLMLPDMDGIEVCKEIKNSEKFKDIPVIILTAKRKEEDKILGLELGADDYVTKPFSPRELVARVNAVLRRTRREKGLVRIGEILKIDFDKFEVFVRDKKIELRPAEFKILKMLAERKGWVFTRRQILENLWEGEKDVLDRTVDVHIRNLRKKLGEAGKFIKSIRGIGYKIEE